MPVVRSKVPFPLTLIVYTYNATCLIVHGEFMIWKYRNGMLNELWCHWISPISNDCSSQQIFLQYRKWSLNFVCRKVSSIEQGEEMSLRNAAEVPQVWFVLESAIKFTVPAQKASARRPTLHYSTRMISKRKWISKKRIVEEYRTSSFFFLLHF